MIELPKTVVVFIGHWCNKASYFTLQNAPGEVTHHVITVVFAPARESASVMSLSLEPSVRAVHRDGRETTAV